MRIWRRSIQWQLIASMGAALLASIPVVVGCIPRRSTA